MKQLVMCGVPRSGSTLVWQLLSSIFPDRAIPQTHPEAWRRDGELLGYDPDECFPVVTIRDPRDNAYSRYRVRLSRSPNAGGSEGLEAVLSVLRRDYKGLESIEVPHLVLRYEEFWNNYDVVFDAIEETFDYWVPGLVRDMLKMEYSIVMNRRRAETQSDFNSMDSKSRIHGDHIGSPAPGSWRETAPRWVRETIDGELAEMARRLNYESV